MVQTMTEYYEGYSRYVEIKHNKDSAISDASRSLTLEKLFLGME